MNSTAEQHIHFCKTEDGVSIAYATFGQGAPLVKVANWLSHLEYDWKSPVWRHWLEGLSRRHHLIRYDERGCGLSDWEVDDFSLEAWVRDLEAVVDAAGLDRFPLLGLSQGGPIAIAYAAKHPERVTHLILHGSYVRGRLHRQPGEEQLREIEMFYELITLGWGKSNPAFRQVFTTMFIPEASSEQMHWFNDLQRISTTPENAARIRRTFSTIEVSDLAQKIKIPTLILHPKNDAIVPFQEGRHMATLIPGSRFVPLESSNHILLADEPAWEYFLEEVDQFLGVTDDGAATLGSAATEARLPDYADLTLREREVLELLAQGYRNQEIAQKLVLTPKTVRNYISIIFGKLGVHSRGEAIVRAREAGFGHDLT
jgi:pimeloyl-ACP methyl ester carboxylesterase/DNA-binding CsgD family transcriptional regulator